MAPPDRVRILLVEDNPGDILLTRKRLEQFPVDIETVGTLQNARDWLAVHRADVILLDLRLPDSEGIDTLRTLRRADDSTPIVVLTISSDDRLGVEAVRSGADEFVCKSDEASSSLHRTIRHAIERNRLQRQIYSIVWKNADAMVVTDQQGKVLFANPAAERLFGQSAAELVGIDLGIFSVSATAAIEVLRPGGTPIEAEVRITQTTWNGAPASLASIRDVTHRRRIDEAEKARARTERRLGLLLERLSVLVWTTDSDRRLLSLDGALGRPESAGDPLTRGRTLDKVFGDGASKLALAHQRALESGSAETEVELDGRVCEVTIRSQTPGEEGAVELLGMAVDVTARRRLEAQFRQAQKLEAIGRLAGGVAHDFRNTLTAISGFAELALESLSAADPVREDLAEILRATESADSLTSQLLAFSRQQPVAPRVVDLGQEIQGTRRLLERLLGEDVEMTLAIPPGLWRTTIDPGAFEQVLANLCVNARDAMPDGGRLTIEARNVELTGDFLSHHALSTEPGEYVLVEVSDTGCGMPEEIRGHIFEPFFTTKEKGKGTGLGLATCYGIVKQAHGFIWVYSEEGVGTTFKVYLPRAEGDVESRAGREPDREVGSRGESILVVEDEDQVRRLAGRLLRSLGYAVTTAANAGEALLLCEDVERKIDLLLTDVMMPRMSGAELVRRLRRTRPNLNVLFMSGYAETAIAHRGILEEGVSLLQKPFTKNGLARRIRAALDGSG